MSKEKKIITLVFLVAVTGSILFLSQSAFGIITECVCSPGMLFPVYVCPPNSTMFSWDQLDAYCIHGSCIWEFEIWCENWGGGTTKTYSRVVITVHGSQLDCCDGSPAWF